MKKILFKSFVYFTLLILLLEGLVRIFHLHKSYPYRYIDQEEVEKWKPLQSGYQVTGNRRQNYVKYNINKQGFNSYRTFSPTIDKTEIAIVGDSFIEGFHQNYDNSIGKKVETQLNGISVYEYGYAGYDFADQLHLIYKYKSQFDLIDMVILGIKFDNDFTREKYAINTDRMAMESPTVRLIQKSKLIVYLQNIGVLDQLRAKLAQILTVGKKEEQTVIQKSEKDIIIQSNLENFEKLANEYNFDKNKFILMLESDISPKIFIDYLKKNEYKFIDLSPGFNNSSKPTTLIYDRHWNDHGRTIVANEIVKEIQKRFY